ncbi:MAG: tol-pal system protein YbgF [Deltaproteobacteria bacterium]|nr:tol-pal system protein YbgF [Deltaproteobacteria bacterium]
MITIFSRSSLCVLTCIVLLATGCVADDEFKRQTLKVNNLQQEVRDMRDESQLRKMEMERLLGQTRESVPELRLEMDRLHTEMQRLVDAIDQSEMRSGLPKGERMSLRNQLEYFGARLDRLETKMHLPPLGPNVVEEAGKTEKPEPKIEVKPGDDEKPSAPDANPEEMDFNAAKDLLKNKSYPQALEKFRGFAAKYPKSKLTPVALFSAGECLYQQQKYEESILEYQKVVKDYAQSDQVPNALLRQAFAFINIGDKPSGKLLLQKIQRQYPNSKAAATAKEKLATLN